jgi:hypothetical protein
LTDLRIVLQSEKRDPFPAFVRSFRHQSAGDVAHWAALRLTRTSHDQPVASLKSMHCISAASHGEIPMARIYASRSVTASLLSMLSSFDRWPTGIGFPDSVARRA